MNNNITINKTTTKHRSIFCALFFLTFFTTAIYAQKPSKEERTLYKKAKKQLINEEYKSSQSNYLKLVEINPKEDLYFFEGGLSYYFSDFLNSFYGLSLHHI